MLLSLDRMGKKSADKVLNEINKSRSMRFSKFLSALGLPGIGPELAFSIANHFETPDVLLQWVKDSSLNPMLLSRLTVIDGVGDIVALQLQDGINLRMSFIIDLLDQLIIQQEQQVIAGGPFDGMTFCVTGTLSESRKSIQARIKSAGGKVVTSVSGNLSILVAGENAGSKLAKAEKLNITVWNEEKLLNQLSVAGSDQAEERQSSQSTLFDY